jgi:hypothetical protein
VSIWATMERPRFSHGLTLWTFGGSFRRPASDGLAEWHAVRDNRVGWWRHAGVLLIVSHCHEKWGTVLMKGGMVLSFLLQVS